MALRTDYPYEEALDDIKDFFQRKVKNKQSKKEMVDYLGICRQEKKVTFRYIYEEYVKYTNKNQDFTPLSNEDKDMIDDLFHFWG